MSPANRPANPPATEPDAEALPVAAVLDDGPQPADSLLAAVAEAQRRAGRRVRGLLMTYPGDAGGADRDCSAAMVLVDIANGEGYLVSQPLGGASQACRADPQGFARASEVMRRALAEPAELVICNRFGGLEAEGGGFSAELLELMAQGVPLLTAVAPRHLEAWQRFTGGAAAVLPADAAAIEAWLARTLPPG